MSIFIAILNNVKLVINMLCFGSNDNCTGNTEKFSVVNTCNMFIFRINKCV